MVPNQSDPMYLNSPNDLNISLRFAAGGSATDVNYICYIGFTNSCIVYDFKQKKFISPYGLH